MNAQDYLAARRADILRSLEAISGERGVELEKALPGGKELVDRIFEYASRGKMLRGSLVYLGAELYGQGDAPGIAETAAAMEFFQAGLLFIPDLRIHALFVSNRPGQRHRILDRLIQLQAVPLFVRGCRDAVK